VYYKKDGKDGFAFDERDERRGGRIQEIKESG